MSTFDPEKYHRRSIRLKGYDYSQEGLYFITICVLEKRCLFGEITKGVLSLNEAGEMVVKWYNELEKKFTDVTCREMVVMPNHFHCILENTGATPVGADLRVRPDDQKILGEYIGSPLHKMVQWFKTMTTNEYIRGVKFRGWEPFHKKLWQRNYWEHIIRNDNDYQEIADYILDNPLNWNKDQLNPKNSRANT